MTDASAAQWTAHRKKDVYDVNNVSPCSPTSAIVTVVRFAAHVNQFTGMRPIASLVRRRGTSDPNGPIPVQRTGRGKSYSGASPEADSTLKDLTWYGLAPNAGGDLRIIGPRKVPSCHEIGASWHYGPQTCGNIEALS